MTKTPTNGPPDVTAEQLMAYADGALESAEALRIAELLAVNPGLQAEVDAYVESRSVLHGVYDDLLDEPVPEHLEALVMSSHGDNVVAFLATKPQRAPAQWFGCWRQAAAAVVILAVGGVAGYHLADDPSVQSLVFAGMLDAHHPLSTALESAPSSELIVIGDERFMAIQSFGTASGAVCREYESGNNDTGIVGIACRSDDGWHVEVVVANMDGVATGGNGYQAASGLDVAAIDEVLYGMGALPGFDSAREDCLLRNDWDMSVCKK